jgi:HK97 family phage portal protein
MKLLDSILKRWGYHKIGAMKEQWFPITQVLNRAGIPITPESALRVAAVFACVRVLAETIASLPLFVYKRLPGGGKEKDPEHPLYKILHDQPNRWQTSFEFFEMLQGHLALRGNGYAEKIWANRLAGEIAELFPLHPDRIKIERLENGRLRYIVRDPGSGQTRAIDQDSMFHVRGLSSDGVQGISVIETASEPIGLAVAAERHGSAYFRNGANIGNVIEHPDEVSDKARTNILNSIQEKNAGADNAFSTYILEEGMKWQRMGTTPQDSQYIETRKFEIEDIARIFRIPPHLIGHLEKATFSNIEHQSLDFVIHTIRPWLVRWEQAMNRDLFFGDLDADNFPEFLVDGLLRGDAKSRSEALQIQFQNGIITMDEWRSIENRNPLPDDQGKKHYVQLNLSPVEEKREMAPMGSNDAFTVWTRDIASKISNAEFREIEKRLGWADHQRRRFDAWLKTFYGQHRSYILRLVGPLGEAYGKTTGAPVAIVELMDSIDDLCSKHYLEIVESNKPVEVLADVCNKEKIADAIFGMFNKIDIMIDAVDVAETIQTIKQHSGQIASLIKGKKKGKNDGKNKTR